MRFLVSGLTGFVLTERPIVKKEKKSGFLWTWLGTVRFFAGLNEGENICVVRHVAVEKVDGSSHAL